MNKAVLKEIYSYIDDHICEKISLAELAAVAGYSPFYFSKLFSMAVGMPVTGYIRVRKLQYSLSSLLEGKRVLDVSLMYAFDSHEGFTRSFTQLFGSTPSTVKKYLTSYQVPEYQVPDHIEERSVYMVSDHNVLFENMHQIVFEVLRSSFEEAEAGFCTEIRITVLPDGKIRIADNGRGIPFSQDTRKNQEVLDKILSGHPISSMEYARMGDFQQCGLQTVNSLCESLEVKVYRDNKMFTQDYVRGIAQHQVLCTEEEHASGTEITLKPDVAIFGDMVFSTGRIRDWIKENSNNEGRPTIKIQLDSLN